MANFERMVDIAKALRDKTISGGKNWHVSFLLRKSKILSIATNDYNKSSSHIRDFDYQPHARLHSEMRASLKIGWQNCEGLTLINIRLNRFNQLGNSCPCSGCTALIQKLGLKRVFYTNEFGQFQQFTY